MMYGLFDVPIPERNTRTSQRKRNPTETLYIDPKKKEIWLPEEVKSQKGRYCKGGYFPYKKVRLV